LPWKASRHNAEGLVRDLDEVVGGRSALLPPRLNPAGILRVDCPQFGHDGASAAIGMSLSKFKPQSHR
jgi:hypothetical protein